MKLLIILLLVLCHGICQADLPGNHKKANTLTVKQAAEIVKKANETRQRELDLSWLTSIDRDIARELSHYGGHRILLGGLTSIDANVAHELTRRQPQPGSWGPATKGLSLNGLTSITKDVAHELVKKANETQQGQLNLNWLTSIDQDVARELSHYGGQKILLDGLTSLTQDVAHELTKVQSGRFGWHNHLSLRPDIPAKSLSLDGLTSITKEVAHELAKCNGDLNLNYVKSMNSEVVREFTKFKGSFLNIQFLESIAPEDVALLKQALKKPTFDYNYRAMMPYELNGDKDWKKWNGKIIEFRKDGSKKKQKEYKYGGLMSRMEWDEAGNLIKEETFPVHKPRGVELNGQSVKPTEVKDLKTEYSEAVLLFNKGRITSEREYPINDLGYDQEGIAYVRGEDEPFTGIAFLDRSDGTRSTEKSFLNGKKHGNSLSIRRDGSIYGIEQFNHGETLRWLYWPKLDSDLQDTRYQNGKQSLKLIWDKDGNLIRKETF
ncbi:MAG: hypothetical protein ACPGFB_15770 [Verrucomicrobiales bacterium]